MTQTIQVPPLPPDIFGPTPMDVAVAVIAVVGTVGVLMIGLMFVRGLVRKWSHPAAGEAEGVGELRHAVQRLGAEVAELQERLDFAERVLATRREAERLERGGS